jgi:hypothetical protein
MSAPIFQVAIIDCDKAGIIGGPFKVIVLKDGRQIASTSGIQGPTGAAGVARNYRSTYGVPETSSAYAHGATAWRVALADDSAPEFPANPYEGEYPPGDEHGTAAARDFRRGFDDAARRDGYTYSRVTGEYCEGGEHETDEFPEPADVREWA